VPGAWAAAATGAAGGSERPGAPYVFANLAEETADPAFELKQLFPRPLGDVSLFLAEDEFGAGLWRTDGTEVGTFRALEFCPGLCRYDFAAFRPATGGRAFAFVYTVDQEGESLWRSDGTIAGTRRLARAQSNKFLDRRAWASASGRLVFSEATEAHGEELWVSDGTVAGTHLLIDLWPGPEGSKPESLYEYDGDVLFTASDGVHGFELWRTDGTRRGTRRITDVNPGASNSGAEVLGTTEGSLLLEAYRPGEGRTLWISDGTAAGTRFLLDIHEREGEAVIAVAEDADRVYFLTDTAEGFLSPLHLWVSDGTVAGTRRLTPRALERDEMKGLRYAALGNGRAVFDWSEDGTGKEVWVTDGSPAGTRPVLGNQCCPTRSNDDLERRYHVRDGLAYIFADDGEHGFEPWVSDGTVGGTRLLADTCPGECDGNPFGRFFDAGDDVLFVSGPEGDRSLWRIPGGVQPPQRLVTGGLVTLGGTALLPGGSRYLLRLLSVAEGWEPWVSDLTAGGTHLLRDPAAAETGPVRSSDPQQLTAFAGRLYLVARVNGRRSLWRSDGDFTGVEPVPVPPSLAAALEAAEPPVLEVAGEHLFAVATGGADGAETVRTWSLPANGSSWTELPPLEAAGPTELAAAGDRLVFLNRNLAVSDGTAAGTGVVIPDLRRPSRSRPGMTEVGDQVYFAGLHPDDLDEELQVNRRVFLWRTDGTADGTVAIHPLGTEVSAPWRGVRLGAGLLFTVDYDEFWVVDGPAQETARRLPVPAEVGTPQAMAAVGDLVLFTDTRRRLWRTDGTAGGTSRWNLPVSHGGAGFFAALDGRVVLRVNVVEGDDAWWSTDGTVAGSTPLPGLDEGGAGGVQVSDGVALVTNTDEVFDTQVAWLTDGTPAGTARLPLVAGRITGLARVGEKLFFAAPHPQLGTELWAVHLDGSAGTNWRTCQPDDKTLCLLDGRFQVRVRWHDPRSGARGTGGARPFPGSDRTGTFWFFNPANVELIVKQLDGRGVNGFFWTFYGALTDVEYRIDVTDLENGATRTFYNRPEEICGRGETEAFPETWAAQPARVGDTATACGSPGALCLHDGRFVLEVDWRDPRTGVTGSGTAIPGTDRTGYFWFFREDNVELVAKVLDGTGVNGHYWVFYGGLTDVEFDLRVTDVVSGDTRRYHNPPGNICGDADTAAF